MTDDDWYVIDDLLQDVFLMKKGRSSSGFNQRTVKKLKEYCRDEEVIQQLMELSEGR